MNAGQRIMRSQASCRRTEVLQTFVAGKLAKARLLQAGKLHIKVAVGLQGQLPGSGACGMQQSMHAALPTALHATAHACSCIAPSKQCCALCRTLDLRALLRYTWHAQTAPHGPLASDNLQQQAGAGMWFRLQPNSLQPAGGTCHGAAAVVPAMHAKRAVAAAVADAEALGAAQHGLVGTGSQLCGGLTSCRTTPKLQAGSGGCAGQVRGQGDGDTSISRLWQKLCCPGPHNRSVQVAQHGARSPLQPGPSTVTCTRRRLERRGCPAAPQAPSCRYEHDGRAVGWQQLGQPCQTPLPLQPREGPVRGCAPPGSGCRRSNLPSLALDSQACTGPQCAHHAKVPASGGGSKQKLSNCSSSGGGAKRRLKAMSASLAVPPPHNSTFEDLISPWTYPWGQERGWGQV